MSRYRNVINIRGGVLLLGLASGLSVAPDDTVGAAAKVGESLGGIDRSDQPAAGVFTPATIERAGPEAERTVRVAIVTERELLVDTDAFAELVFDTANDERGWGGDGSVSFDLVIEEADLTIRLAAPGTVDELCAPLPTNGYTSCRIGDEIILNVDRWSSATPDFLDAGGTVEDYRTYLVNHETGHYLGYGHETSCRADGRAPVMMQQTLDLGGCEPNGWPRIP